MAEFKSTYENFDIHIHKVENGYGINAESKAGETVCTTVQSLPSGEDFTDAEYFLRELMGSDGDAQLLGEQIYDFLFPPVVKSLFDKSFGHAKERGNGVRIRLRLKADQPTLSRIPWEYCRNKKDSFFALDRKTPLVRYLHLDEPPISINMPDSIRVLFVTANPEGTDDLDIEEEEDRLRDALQPLLKNGRGRIQLQSLHQTTRNKLSAAVLEFKPHIIHFSGHGSIEDGQSLLLLEDDQGKIKSVGTDALRVLLNGSSVQLVILNACQTADHNEASVFSGVAQGLVRAGIPAAIGMQFKVPDMVAHTFTQVLYQQLVDGVPLDTAVTEARISICFNHDNTNYWGIPALFMRAKDGMLWNSSFLDEIKQRFEEETSQTLENVKIEITDIGELPRNDVVDSIEKQLETHRQVILFGSAGSGKSGIAKKLVESAQKSQWVVLLLDARYVIDKESRSDLGKYFNLDSDLLEAITKIANYKPCRIIIDQFDNVIGSKAAMVLTKLALGCCQVPNVEIILISRQNPYFSRSIEVNDLLDAGFERQKCDELDDSVVVDILHELMVPDPSNVLIKLAKNLLNLEIISQIKKRHQNADFSNITNTIVLWELYLKTIKRREASIPGGDYADEIIIEATRLARKNLKDGKSEFVLAKPINKHQRRLIGTMLTNLGGQVYRFFHEELQYFLYAREATDQGKMPQDIFEEIEHLVKNVLLWMKNLYFQSSTESTYDGQIYEKFLSASFNSNKQIPFYAETELLDEFINSNNPSSDSIALKVVIELLNTREDLRTYFFRKGPNPAWAEILWQQGFLDSPPSPEERDDGTFMPWWDVQQFLLSVAGQVPHIAVKHAETIEAHPIYISRAILALCVVPPDQLSPVIPRIIQWVEDPQFSQAIAASTFDLIAHLIQKDDEVNALLLFEALTMPLPPANVQDVAGTAFRTEARSRYQSTWLEDRDRVLGKCDEVFTGPSLIKVVAILESHLCLSLKLEVEASGRLDDAFKSRWRSAIEEGDQDVHKSYKDHLLQALRNVLEKLVLNNQSFVEAQIKRLLEDEHEILRRLALHLLNRFPEQFPDIVSQVLRIPENLNNIGIHHEIFVLLQMGYPVLTSADKEGLLKEIITGPPFAEVNRLALRAEQNYEEDRL